MEKRPSSLPNGVTSLASKTTVNNMPKSMLSYVKWEYMAAGVTGGVLSTLVLHPLDLVKIRFQANEGTSFAHQQRPQYTGVRHALKTIFMDRGFAGLYQGVTPNAWGAGMAWGLYFFFYNSIKTWMQDGDSTKSVGPLKHITAASEAGFITLVLTNPIWVTKTRLCLQYEGVNKAVSTTSTTVYKGMFDALIKIYKTEGLRGWYKGFIPGVIGISHGAIQFMIYEQMKDMYNQHHTRSIDTRLTTFEYLLFSATSKTIAATLTYPYQVVRSRIQDQHRHYNGIIDVIQQTFKVEGTRGFYKGMSAYLLHVTPNICLVFLIYERLPKWKMWADKLEGVKGFYKGLVPGLLRVTPACCITFVAYENIITYLLHNDKVKKPG